MKVDPQFEHLLVVDSRDYLSGDEVSNKSAGVADQSWNDWDEPVTARPYFTNPLNFSKGSIGYKLKITRVEQKIIDGEKWTYGYAGDELVDARVVGSFL